MYVRVDGELFDVDDPRKRVEAIRRWLRKKAEDKTFTLPELPREDPSKPGDTTAKPFAPLRG